VVTEVTPMTVNWPALRAAGVRILIAYDAVSQNSVQRRHRHRDQHSKNTGASTSRACSPRQSETSSSAKITGGASTITMQLAGNSFLDRSDRSFARKMQEILLALQNRARYTKPQIFTMYATRCIWHTAIMALRGLAFISASGN